jgi:hypothetical protein
VSEPPSADHPAIREVIDKGDAKPGPSAEQAADELVRAMAAVRDQALALLASDPDKVMATRTVLGIRSLADRSDWLAGPAASLLNRIYLDLVRPPGSADGESA